MRVWGAIKGATKGRRRASTTSLARGLVEGTRRLPFAVTAWVPLRGPSCPPCASTGPTAASMAKLIQWGMIRELSPNAEGDLDKHRFLRSDRLG